MSGGSERRRGNRRPSLLPVLPHNSELDLYAQFWHTYRAVYTVQLGDAVYVLHCFQKKSAKGIKTPKHILELVEQPPEIGDSNAQKRSN